MKLYTADGYEEINKHLYGTSKLKGIAQIKKNLDSALQKTPDAPTELWRSVSGGFDYSKELIENAKIGTIIDMPGYLSTSETAHGLMHLPNDTEIYIKETPKDHVQVKPHPTIPRLKMTDTPEEYTHGSARNVIFKIKAKKAAPVSTLRHVNAEQEWLIPRGKKFKVINIHRNVEIGELENFREGIRSQIIEIEEI